MKIDSIKNGIVLDHIRAGKSLEVYTALGLDKLDCSVAIIKNGELVEKKKLQLPKKIINVERCKNPRCITSTEQGLDHVFYLANEEKRIYRCLYCETKVEKK